MLRCPGGSLHRSASQSGCAPFGNDDPVRARAIRGANQCAEVVRILDAIEHDEKAMLAVSLLQQRIHVGVLLAAGDRDDTLMSVGIGGAIELLARQKTHLHSAGTAIVDDVAAPADRAARARYPHIRSYVPPT